MKIGLIDVDGHNFPNLPLMKISAYHKAKGDIVEWWDSFARYDHIYASKVFTDSREKFFFNNGPITRGGSGYGDNTKLNDGIEHQYPDYSIYPVFADEALGFLTRGCPRRCGFCIVSNKEGAVSSQVADLSEFWRGQKHIKLLDPNILAAREHIELLRQLVASGAVVDFTQGLDIRLLNSDNIELLKEIRVKTWRFAWDGNAHSDEILSALRKFKAELRLSTRRVSVYVLTNYDTSFDFDLYRITLVTEH